jgi:hypothetical protein
MLNALPHFQNQYKIIIPLAYLPPPHFLMETMEQDVKSSTFRHIVRSRTNLEAGSGFAGLSSPEY